MILLHVDNQHNFLILDSFFIMLIYRTFIFLFLQLFLSCNALRCTTECSFSSSLTTPVKIPDRCNQIVSANRCYAAVIFSYHRGEYYISLQTDPSKPALVLENRRNVLLKFLLNAPTNFSYTVEKECSDRDDCARELITHIATDIFRRQLDYSTIVNEVYPLVIGPSLTPDDPYLKCYGSNQTVEKMYYIDYTSYLFNNGPDVRKPNIL